MKDQTNKPACPTTCSHCWGFLGVIGRRDEVPQLLCVVHVEFCIGRPKNNLSESFFSAHTHSSVFSQTGGEDLRLQTFWPNGWTTSPWKQCLNQDRAKTCRGGWALILCNRFIKHLQKALVFYWNHQTELNTQMLTTWEPVSSFKMMMMHVDLLNIFLINKKMNWKKAKMKRCFFLSVEIL